MAGLTISILTAAGGESIIFPRAPGKSGLSEGGLDPKMRLGGEFRKPVGQGGSVMRDMRRDLTQAVIMGVKAATLAVAVLSGVFVGVWGAEMTSPLGVECHTAVWLGPVWRSGYSPRSINVPINNSVTTTSSSSPILGTGER